MKSTQSPKLKPHVKKKWLEALRSGKFKQGRGALHRVHYGADAKKEFERFCCLGVLCAIAPKGLVERARIPENLANYYDKDIRYDNTDTYLPRKIVDWAFKPGRGSKDPVVSFVKDGSSTKTLSYLNDEYKKNFRFIANKIEKDL